MLHVYNGKCLSHKAVHNWVANVLLMKKVAETTVKILLYCGFRRTDKAMGQVYQCWWRICQVKIVFSRFECHIFTFTFFDSPSYLIFSIYSPYILWVLR
jgi:hypothetical protein